MKKINICIIDDHALMAKLLARTLDETKGMEVLYTAKDGDDFFVKLKNSRICPDIVLMDLEMPNMNGFDTTKRIHKLYPNIKIVIITMHTDSYYIKSLIKEGVDGYLSKYDEQNTVIKAIQAVSEGETFYNQHALQVLSANIKSSKKGRYALGKNGIPLSNRELEVLTLLAEGKVTSEIIEEMSVTKSTVNAHKANILIKTGSRTSIEAVIYAFEQGIVDVMNKRKFVID